MPKLSFIDAQKTFEENMKVANDLGLIYRDYTELGLYLLKYNKSKARLNDIDVEQCRGLIMDRETHEIVMAPPIKSRKFTEEQIEHGPITYEDFIDGTNINAFYYKGSWNISTRSSIGAEVSFNTEKTFKELFYEAIDFKLEDLNQDYCYSFVLMHPESRIVCTTEIPIVYLVEVKQIHADRIEYIDTQTFENMNVPERFEFANINDAVNITKATPGIESQGIMIKIGNYRDKVRRNEYHYAREIKGNTTNLLERYLTLNKLNAVSEYLKYYPENNQKFINYSVTMTTIVNTLYKSYIDCFVNKKIKHSELPFIYKPLVYTLHKNYFETREPTTLENVYRFMNSLDIQKLLFIIDNKDKE
jgi:hypothetical protein